MKKLVVIAEAEEMKLVKELGYDKYPVLVTGVGALNVINTLKDLPKDITIFNIGYAGSKNIEPGKFYSVNTVSLYHPNVDYPEPVYCLGWIPYSYNEENDEEEDVLYLPKRCLTGTDFVLSSDIDDCLFDMELAYIAALGFKDVIAYKYVSDNLDLQEYRKTLNEE